MNISFYPLLLVIGIFFIALFYIIAIYNRMISLRNQVKKDWANIDVLLKQRNSQLPKLIETCKQYMGYENNTLLGLTKLRTNSVEAHEKNDINTLSNAESLMESSLRKLFAVSENYPDLKTNQVFIELQKSIEFLENSISDRREVYNESVNNNNVIIEQFPYFIFATIFCFKHVQLLTFTKEETADVEIKTLFNEK